MPHQGPDGPTAPATTPEGNLVDTAVATASTTAGAPPERSGSRHRYDIDLIRLFCGASVILGHTGAVFINHVDSDPANGAAVYWVGHLAEAVNPWAVPSFFAIAGWAVLSGAPPRNETSMLRRIWRHFVPLWFWIGAYVLLAKALDEHTEPVYKMLIGSTFNSGHNGTNHLWYLYSYIPLVAVLGLLSLFLRGNRPRVLAAIAALAACGTLLFSTLADQFGFTDPEFRWGLAGYQPIYAVIGAFVLHLWVPSRIPRWVWGGLLACCAVAVGWYETQVQYPITNANPIVGLMCLSFLMLLRGATITEKYRPFVKTMASCSFGAYLIHVLVQKLTVARWVEADLSLGSATALLLGSWVLSVLACYGLSYLWGRLPGARKILG